MTIAGQLRGDVDCFRIRRKAGERISVEVDSVWLTEVAYGDAENDVAVEILAADGKLIARNDDRPLHVQDPMLSIAAPADGEYIVQRHQSVPLNSEVDYLAHVHSNAAPSESPAVNPSAKLLTGMIDEKFKEEVH